jgi:hypothetical protein
VRLTFQESLDRGDICIQTVNTIARGLHVHIKHKHRYNFLRS